MLFLYQTYHKLYFRVAVIVEKGLTNYSKAHVVTGPLVLVTRHKNKTDLYDAGG